MSEIEACRTCGIFFLFSSNYLRHLYSNEAEIVQIRQLLENWNVKLNESDSFPQYICTVCVLEFCKIAKFKDACLETQEQLRQLYNIQQENIHKKQIKLEPGENVTVKTEPVYNPIGDNEPNACTFIYIDDLSDSEYENEGTDIPQFKVPPIPIKEEIIEEAHVPIESIDKHHVVVPKIEPEPEKVVAPQLSDSKPTGFVSEISMDGSEVQCEFCLHVSADQQDYRQHLLRIHERKPLECHICGKQFKIGTTQTRFKYHLKWHRLNKHIKCPQCGFHCASRDILNEHTRAVHTKVPCKVCGKRFLPKKLRQHLEEHPVEENESLQIENVSYSINNFASELAGNQHIIIAQPRETTHPLGRRSLSNEFINLESEETPQENIMGSGSETSSTETASTAISFSPDDQSANIAQSYVIDQGGECSNFSQEIDDALSYETTLENEMSTVHLTSHELDEMAFNCAQCPESFPKVEQLIAHAEVHREKARFSCDICNKKFDLKFSLNRHMKRHKNITY